MKCWKLAGYIIRTYMRKLREVLEDSILATGVSHCGNKFGTTCQQHRGIILQWTTITLILMDNDNIHTD